VTEKQISQSAIKRLKEQLKGHLLLGMENTVHRMSRLAKNEIYFGRQIPLSESVEKINELSQKKIFDVAEKLFNLNKLNIIQMVGNA